MSHSGSIMKQAAWVAAWLALWLLAGCDSKPQTAGPALVRVNGHHIDAQQVEREAARVAATVDGTSREKLLETMIDRQLLKDEALRRHLDRDPQVKLALEQATTSILAQAWLQAKVEQTGKPSAAEIETYYRAHPAQFAGRKIYELRQLLLTEKDFSDELKKVVDGAQTLEDAAAWLDGRGIRYAQGRLVRGSDELPAAVESRLRDIEKGRLFILNDGRNVILMCIEGVRERPLGIDAATAGITEALLREKRERLADVERGRLRAAARIEYPGMPALRLASGQQGAEGTGLGR